MSVDAISGIQPMGFVYEQSWHDTLFHGRCIVPEARDQGLYGRHGKCAFYSFTSDGEMEMLKELAVSGLPEGDVKFDPESLVRDFIKLHGGKQLGEDHLDRAATIAWIFKYLGIEATSSDWDGVQRLAINDFKDHGKIGFDEAMSFLDSGRPFVGSFLAGDDFDDLGPDEIYRYKPTKLVTGETVRPARHRVVFVGYGDSEDDEPFLTFLNSYGKGFGKNGIGRVFLSEVSNVYSLSISARPPPPTHSLSSDGQLRAL